MCMTFNSAIPPPEIYPKEIIEFVHKYLSTRMLTTVLFCETLGVRSIDVGIDRLGGGYMGLHYCISFLLLL